MKAENTNAQDTVTKYQTYFEHQIQHYCHEMIHFATALIKQAPTPSEAMVFWLKVCVCVCCFVVFQCLLVGPCDRSVRTTLAI